MILDGHLDFDVIYSETKIASELSVSRTPMRDALVRLSQERFVDILPSRGFKLHKPDSSDLQEAYQVRVAVECFCADLLAASCHTAQGERAISEIAGFLKQQDQALASENWKEFWALDMRFHTAIVSFAGNRIFDDLHTVFMHFFTSLPVERFHADQRDMATMSEHTELISALKSSRPGAASAAARHHLDESLSFIINHTHQN